MSREQKSHLARQRTFIMQFMVQGFLSARTPKQARDRLRKLLIYWCRHPYLTTLAAGLAAVKPGVRAPLGRIERAALLIQSNPLFPVVVRIVYGVLAPPAAKDELVPLLEVPHADVVRWSIAAATGDTAAEPPDSADADTLQWVVEQASRVLCLLGSVDLGERLAVALADLERNARNRSATMTLAPLFRANIGHQVIALSLLQGCRDGVFGQESVRQLPGRSHNPYLVSLVDGLIEPVDGAQGFVEPISGGKIYRTEDGRIVPATELMSRAIDRWDEMSPPLAIDAQTRARGDAVLAGLGIPPETPIVSLHVREPGWYTTYDPLNIRDAEIASYRAAASYLAERGIRVIRLGDRSMSPLPAGMLALDYAHSELKSDWMDVYIAARCRFHIGTASGMSFVPILFGRPVLFTNYAPIGHFLDARQMVTIFKVARALNGSIIPFEDLTRRHIHAASDNDLDLLGAWLEDNAEEDILEAVRFVDRHIEDGTLRFPEGTFDVPRAAMARAGLAKRPQVPPQFWARYYGS